MSRFGAQYRKSKEKLKIEMEAEMGKKYNVTVNGTTYAVEVEEIGGVPTVMAAAAVAPAPAPMSQAPAPVAAAPAPTPAATASADAIVVDAPM
ncbi:MAG: hypothetical protein LBH63_04720, partial [Clostridiales Family XIII bacterium]|nr:hypothetical protein [Clostridiales Family XIII bacterium]